MSSYYVVLSLNFKLCIGISKKVAALYVKRGNPLENDLKVLFTFCKYCSTRYRYSVPSGTYSEGMCILLKIFLICKS
jgi:hypothetical protein